MGIWCLNAPREVGVTVPLSQWGNGGSEKLSGLPEVTQPRSAGLRLKPSVPVPAPYGLLAYQISALEICDGYLPCAS